MKTKVMHLWEYEVYGKNKIVVENRQNIAEEFGVIVNHVRDSYGEDLPDYLPRSVRFLCSLEVEVTSG